MENNLLFSISVVLFVIGVITYIVGGFCFLIDMFRESVLWGLAGIWFPVVDVVFVILYFDKCKKSLAIMLLGILVMIPLGLFALLM